MRRAWFAAALVAGLSTAAALGGDLAAAGRDDALIRAIRDRDRTKVAALIQGRADISQSGNDGTTVLHWAAHVNDLEIACGLRGRAREGSRGRATRSRTCCGRGRCTRVGAVSR